LGLLRTDFCNARYRATGRHSTVWTSWAASQAFGSRERFNANTARKTPLAQ